MLARLNIRLMASSKMSAAKEHDYIRFPLKARSYFGIDASVITVGKGATRVSLQVKQALREDVERLNKMVAGRKITSEGAASVGFVTRSVFSRINKEKEGNCWLSDEMGPVTVGADPEFGFLDAQKNFVRADNVLPANAKFGSDGPGAEIRPDPARNHIELVANISHLLQNPPAPARSLSWVGGATYSAPNRTYWFGGHIHFGRPSEIDFVRAPDCYECIATVLDDYVALPLVRLDKPNPHLRRAGCGHGYGKAGIWDTDSPASSIRYSHVNEEGDSDHFEYRVLSGLWLTHPTLARIVIGSSKCIAETAYERMASSKYDYDWINMPPSRNGLLKTFGIENLRRVRHTINHSSVSAISREDIDSWKGRIRELEYYKEYSREIEALISLVENWSEVIPGLDLDVRRNWDEKTSLLPKTKNSELRTALAAVEER